MKSRFFIGWMLLVMVSCTPVETQDFVSLFCVWFYVNFKIQFHDLHKTKKIDFFLAKSNFLPIFTASFRHREDARYNQWGMILLQVTWECSSFQEPCNKGDCITTPIPIAWVACYTPFITGLCYNLQVRCELNPRFFVCFPTREM